MFVDIFFAIRPITTKLCIRTNLTSQETISSVLIWHFSKKSMLNSLDGLSDFIRMRKKKLRNNYL